MEDFNKQSDIVEDPTTSKFWLIGLVVAIVLLLVGIVILIAGNLIVGFIITLLGAVFGIGNQVAKNRQLKL